MGFRPLQLARSRSRAEKATDKSAANNREEQTVRGRTPEHQATSWRLKKRTEGSNIVAAVSGGPDSVYLPVKLSSNRNPDVVGM